LFAFFSSVIVSAAGSSVFGSSIFCSSFFSSISLVISSIGLGGGVVAIVHPIHAPIAKIAMNATSTGTSTATSLIESPFELIESKLATSPGNMTRIVYLC
jgi:hypothetical protein